MSAGLLDTATANLSQFNVQSEKAIQSPNDGRLVYARRPATMADGRPAGNPGYIVSIPDSPVEFRRYSMRGFQTLPAYGTFTDSSGGALLIHAPFQRILLNGGAKEFPIAQIREYRWHRYPPTFWNNGEKVVVTFPQVVTNPETGNVVENGEELVDHFCPDCANGEFFLTEASLRAHQAIVHKAVAGSRQLATQIATAQHEASVPTVEVLKDAIDTLRAGQEAIASEMAEQRRITNVLLQKLLDGSSRRSG